MNLRSHVEALTRSEIRGWAADAGQPGAPLAIDLFVAGKRIAGTMADQPRPDLVALGLGAHNFGFVLAVPEGTKLDIRSAELRVGGTQAVLPGLREAARHEGVLEQISGTLITGWAWRAWVAEQRVTVLVRDTQKVIARVVADRARTDLLASGIGDGRYGFEFELRSLADWHRIDTATLTCMFEATGEPLHDLRPGRARAPISLPAGRTIYSAKRPPEAPAPPAPTQQAVEAPRPARAAASAPAAPASPRTGSVVARPSVWRGSPPPAAIAKPAPAARLDRPPEPAPAPPPDRPARQLSPELLQAMRESLNFGEDDPFV